ncbi:MULTISPECIES: type II toxin-antitoxin system VapC family toxin [unclassified Rhizobium]|uniref:type II toxin-antitoxin system VapC family toxin n=1 Tax=unclassified Rhizobium TaxID=2613769 RepID=UPI002478A9A0|nr:MULTISPECIES: type II toxin-antitoxin system VapC family toxin [unclassified Rhizobium]
MAGPIFLMDTNILSNAGLQRPPPGLRSWMKAMGTESLAISFPAIAELRRGAHLALKHDPQKAQRLHNWIDDILSVDFQFAELTSKAANLYAEMTTVGPLRHLHVPSPEQKKDKIGHDLLFAALSITHQMPIASFNVKDFILIDKYFPLPGVFHPVEVQWHVPRHAVIPNDDYGMTPPSLPEFVSSGFGFMR